MDMFEYRERVERKNFFWKSRIEIFVIEWEKIWTTGRFLFSDVVSEVKTILSITNPPFRFMSFIPSWYSILNSQINHLWENS